MSEFRSKGRGDARFISVSKDPGKATCGDSQVVGWHIGRGPDSEIGGANPGRRSKHSTQRHSETL